MSFPLRRLPLLAISEVIKSMNIREIFLFSLVSKKSQNFVMLSIPKNSLSAKFIFKEDGLKFEVMPKGSRKEWVDILPVAQYRTEHELVSTRFSTCGLYVQCKFSSPSDTSGVEDSIRKLFNRFSKTFKSSKFYLEFGESSREGFAMDLIRFVWENGFLLDQINFSLDNASPKSIQELLDGCHKHHTSLYIGTKLPDGFKYLPPPGGYDIDFFIAGYPHWVNLDDFLQCRKIHFVRGFTDTTVEYLNGLLKKIVNLECRLESFFFKLRAIQPSDFAEIVRGLSESTIIQNEQWQELQFKRKDGMKMLITLYGVYLDLEEDYL